MELRIDVIESEIKDIKEKITKEICTRDMFEQAEDVEGIDICTEIILNLQEKIKLLEERIQLINEATELLKNNNIEPSQLCQEFKTITSMYVNRKGIDTK